MKGALFDLDGVIADTSVYHFKAWQKLVAGNFHQQLPAEFEEKTKGVSRGDSLKVILSYLNVQVTSTEFDKLAAEKNDVYRDFLGKLTPANILPGISQLLIDLKSNGYRLALASASLNAPLILDKLDLSTDFDAIADPSQVAAGKPAPDIFLAAAAAINVPIEDCLGIEDSIAGIQAINAAHALSIGIGSAENLKNTDLLVPNTAALTYAKVASVWK